MTATPQRAIVFVVVTEWDGPGYKNPGDASVSVVEGVATTRRQAEHIRDAAIAEGVDFGHEPWNGENPDTWCFDVEIHEVPLLD